MGRLGGTVLLVGILVAILAACAPQPASSSLTRISHPNDLAGTAWELVTIGGTAPSSGPSVTLLFGRGEVSGNGSCNAFGGSYAYDPSTGALRVGDLVSTKRACIEPGRNEVEAAYLAALRAATDASIDENGRLVISGAGAPLVLAVGGVPVGPPVTQPPAS
jgi:putative lipoprotein